MKKRILTLIICFVMSLVFILTASAQGIDSPYNTYEYNYFDEPVDAPVGYVPTLTIDADYLKMDKQFNNITDMVYKDGIIYLLDGGNSRIIALDSNYNLLKEFKDFKVGNFDREHLISVLGEGVISFEGAKGMAISNDGKFYVADTQNNRVLCFNENCEAEMVILRPDEKLNNTGAAFSPIKVAVDSKDRIYVASDLITLGLMVFGNDGNFMYFFGANEVLSTTQAIVKAFRKTFMTLTQIELVDQETPVSIRNMDVDEKGFIYTVSPYRDTTVKAAVPGMVRKLNFKGNDTLNSSIVFGDLEESEKKKTWFKDIDIDDDGFINLLDEGRGRIFQYTESGMLVSVFGATGQQVGCLTTPNAIESVNGNILVADGEKNCIFVYSPTDYVKTVRSAVIKMQNNDLDGSEEEWNTILSLNSNNNFAYEGLGRIYDYKGDYKTAMKYYKLAYAQNEYALAYQQHRQQLIENHAFLLLLCVAVFIALIAVAAKLLKKYTAPIEGSAYSRMETKYTIPFYVLLHPIDGCEQFKRRKITSLRVSFAVVFLWLVAKILSYKFTGFAFAINRSSEFNILVEIAVTFGIFVLFVLSNWVVSLLSDGKGSARDIIATVAYSMIPYVISQFIAVLLTNFLVPTESVFIEIVKIIGIIWTLVIMFLGLMTIHEYSVGKTIWSVILTLVGIIIIIFLIILLYSLLQQLIDFIRSVYKEILFRE